MSEEQFFPYERDDRWSFLFMALGVDDDDGVTLKANGDFLATYGRWKVETPIANIDQTEVTGPHRWYTAVGLRASAADDGATFGTNHHAGLCIAFKEKVPKVVGFRSHSALWVSVADPEGLAQAIAERT